jgi:hypothetical protein
MLLHMPPTLTDCLKNWQFLVQLLAPVVTILVAFLVYLFAKRNMRNETVERLSRFRKEKLIEAGMAFWGLLTYTSLVENPFCIIRWKKQRESSVTKYFINVENAKNFMVQLNKINFEKGYGLFVSNATRGYFYEYRNILYGFLLANKHLQDDEILVENEEMIQRMKNIHDLMIVNLRREMELTKPSLEG